MKAIRSQNEISTWISIKTFTRVPLQAKLLKCEPLINITFTIEITIPWQAIFFWYQQSHIYTKAAKRIIKIMAFPAFSNFSSQKIPIKSHNKIANRKTFRSPKNIYFSGIGPTRALNKNVKYCLCSVDVSKTFRLASSNLIWNVFFVTKIMIFYQKFLLSFPIYFWGNGISLELIM
jgi:hypothetical protein